MTSADDKAVSAAWWDAWLSVDKSYDGRADLVVSAVSGEDPDAARETVAKGAKAGFRPQRALIAARRVTPKAMRNLADNPPSRKQPAKPPPVKRATTLDPAGLDPSLMGMVKFDVCRRLGIVPVGFQNGVLAIARASALTGTEEKELLRQSSEIKSIETTLVPLENIHLARDYLASQHSSIGGDGEDGAVMTDSDAVDLWPQLTDTTGDHAADGERIANWFNLASAYKSADIHIHTAVDTETGNIVGEVRIERLGSLRCIDRLDGAQCRRLMARIRTVTKVPDDAVTANHGTGLIMNPLTGEKVSLRLEVVPKADKCQMMTIRRLVLGQSTDWSLSRLFDVNVMREPYDLLWRAARQTDGLVLVTGRTGSGKSTTLAAVLNEVVAHSTETAPDGSTHITKKIVSAESPVEYRIPGVDQVAVSTASGGRFGFLDALEAFLRSAPNVIMIGEIRDDKTAAAAVRAAETGHLVMSTLHAKDAASTLSRLRGLGIDADAFASSVSMIVAQRLLRTICPECRQDPELAKDCDHCYRSGWAGRAAVIEVLEVTEDLLAALTKKRLPQPAEIREMQQVTFARHAQALVAAGKTTQAEVEASLGRLAHTG